MCVRACMRVWESAYTVKLSAFSPGDFRRAGQSGTCFCLGETSQTDLGGLVAM